MAHPLHHLLRLLHLPPTSFLHLLLSSKFTPTVPSTLLNSPTFTLINPRTHRTATDTVSLVLPSSLLPILNDETLLALFTHGFFGGWIFAFERTITKLGAWRLLPVSFTAFPSHGTERATWNRAEIPKTNLIAVGDVLFGSFKLLDAHLATPSDSSPSYLDFGFGSDEASFAGCHRFSVRRTPGRMCGEGQVGAGEVAMRGGEEARGEGLGEGKGSGWERGNSEGEGKAGADGGGGEEGVEISLQHFRCNPRHDVDSWAEYFSWFHYWYAKALFADGVRACLRGQ